MGRDPRFCFIQHLEANDHLPNWTPYLAILLGILTHYIPLGRYVVSDFWLLVQTMWLHFRVAMERTYIPYFLPRLVVETNNWNFRVYG